MQSKGQYLVASSYGDSDRLPLVSVLNITAVYLLC